MKLPASAFAITLLTAACGDPPETGAGAPAPGASGSNVATSPAPGDAPPTRLPAPERAGGTMMRSADGKRFYIADEDNRTIRVLTAPILAAAKPRDASETAPAPSASASGSASAKPTPPPNPKGRAITEPGPPPPNVEHVTVELPGPPANLLPLDGRVLVTLRDPGALLIMKELPDGKLEEEARVELPADAWGLAITKDESTAVVTSAWTHKVTGIDLASGKQRWSLDVPREPRGVVVHPTTNVAYVTHLMGAELTRIDGVTTAEASHKPVLLPPGPALTPSGSKLTATLGYALTFDDAGHRLLVARHAQGGLGPSRWAGAPTIDVLQTATDEPLVSPRVPEKVLAAAPEFYAARTEVNSPDFPASYLRAQFRGAQIQGGLGVQPRAMVVAHKTGTVWIASEGEDVVTEFDMQSPAPAMSPRRSFRVGGAYFGDPRTIGGHFIDIPWHCGAPSGLALSEDEAQLYVYCRSTSDVARVELDIENKTRSFDTRTASSNVSVGRLAEDALGPEGSRGRRLFYGAMDSFVSGGLGCAGCHPEGRDDGHIWHEIEGRNGTHAFLAHQNLADKTKEGRLGVPRQTPMLVGRVDSPGPYGWQAQNKGLTERLAEGFMLHRWEPWEPADPNHWMTGIRVNALALYLRKGLVAPPRPASSNAEAEARGKKVFEDPKTECAQCHTPATSFTNRIAYKVERGPQRAGFEEEPTALFKTPSLKFVGGSPPYYHDGRVRTLTELIQTNNDRMGKTNHLSAEDKKALVAYLETL